MGVLKEPSVEQLADAVGLGHHLAGRDEVVLVIPAKLEKLLLDRRVVPVKDQTSQRAKLREYLRQVGDWGAKDRRHFRRIARSRQARAQDLPAAFKSRRSSWGKEKMSDSSAAVKISTSPNPRSASH